MSVCTPIVEVLASHRFRYASEDELQAALATVLGEAGFDVEREVRLDARSRVDLLVGRVGVEVKVAGKQDAVVRQARRYLERRSSTTGWEPTCAHADGGGALDSA